MLLPRIITAIIGIPIIIISIYYGKLVFFLLLLTILFYMTREFVYMTRKVGYETSWFISYLSSILVFISIILEQLKFSEYSLYLTSVILTFIFFILFFVEIIKQKPLGAVGRISVNFTIPVLFGWSLAHLYLLRDIKIYGMKLVFILVFTIWTVDNSAYIFGTLFGRKKLASVISPKKTIVGFITGWAFGFLGFLFFSRIFLIDKVISYNYIIPIGVVLPVISMLSDLAESLIKRDCGFKDSDNLLFGHGGMMDRFDSFIFTSPFLYYIIIFILINR